MADEVKKDVENVQANASAPATGVEQKPAEAPAGDPEAKLAALLEENDKLRRDRDNYRNAALALKGKKELEELDLTDPLQAATFINKSIEDRLLQEKEARSDASLADYAKELARKNKELTLALGNKSPVSSVSSGGGGSEVKDVHTGYFAPDQIEALKARWKSQGFKESDYDSMLRNAEIAAKRGV